MPEPEKGAPAPAPAPAEGAAPNTAPEAAAAAAGEGAGNKAGEAAPAAAPAVPEKYDLKLPEGSKLDPARVEGIAAFAKERGLSQDAAQALLQREAEAVEGYAQAQVAEVEKAKAGWLEAVKTDPEVGGDNLPQNAELAKRVLARYGSESLNKTLETTGLGNHPELVRLLVRISKSMTEDQLVLPSAASAGKKSDQELFYGPPKN